VGDKARPAVAVGDGERLHQVPAREIGGRNVPHLALADKRVQRVLNLFNWRERVEAVQVVDVDVICAEATQAGLKRAAQMVARGTSIVWSVAGWKMRFG
jgi:hypothetical protein